MLIISAFGQSQTLSVTVNTGKQSYDQGQLISITGIVQDSGSPVPNVVVVFELRDPQKQVRASGFTTTNSSGGYSRQIMIGNDFPNGAYSVYVSVTVGSQSASATTEFQAVPEFSSAWMLVIAFTMAIIILGRKLRMIPLDVSSSTTNVGVRRRKLKP